MSAAIATRPVPAPVKSLPWGRAGWKGATHEGRISVRTDGRALIAVETTHGCAVTHLRMERAELLQMRDAITRAIEDADLVAAEAAAARSGVPA